MAESLADKLGIDDASVDVEAFYERFKSETGSHDTDRFLGWLFDQGVITVNAFKRAHAGGRMDVVATVPGGGSEVKDAPHRTYRILGLVGEGAMGKVFVARDPDLRRKVAYKVLKQPDQGKQRIIRHRFLNEAQITAQLDHPNIVPVYTLEKEARTEGTDGQLAFAMKLVYGQTLEEYLRDCRRQATDGAFDDDHDLQARLEIFLKLCDAMAYAHAKGVIHRDLKPANVMIGPFGEVYAMDWGLARLLDPHERSISEAELYELPPQVEHLEVTQDDIEAARTRIGQILGTPRYMAPEQAQGRNHFVDERSDQYALGAILFELCGMLPAYPQTKSVDVLVRVSAGKKATLAPYPGGNRIPRELRAVIDKAMALDGRHRYETVAHLADDVRRFQRGDAVLAQPDAPLQAAGRWARKHRGTTAAVVGVVLLLFAAIAIWALAQQAAQAEASAIREHQLTQFQQLAFERVHAIDNHLLTYEGQLKGLAATAIRALESGTPSTDKPWSNEEFIAGKLPPGAAMAPLYNKVVSIDWPVFKVAPGVRRDKVMPLVAQLMPLRHWYKRMFLESALGPKASPLVADDKAVKLLTESGVPLRWAYIGLSDGVMFSYPGKGGYPAEYDPRLRPWYKLGVGKHGVYWGNPYIDLQGQGFILPSVKPLWGSTGKFLGVAGIELTFDYLIKTLMDLRDPAIEETFLLNQQARIVVRSSDKGKEFEGGELHDANTLPLFFVPDVVKGCTTGKAGLLEVTHEGQDLVVAHAPIEAIGWHYVVLAKADVLLKDAR